jgi:hypothetical protein
VSVDSISAAVLDVLCSLWALVSVAFISRA